MTKNQNTFKNTFKAPAEPEIPTKKKAIKEKKTKIKSPKESNKLNLSFSDKSIRIIGLILLLSSLFMLLSFISFIFTWKYDLAYPIQGNTIESLLYQNLTGENIMGKLGSLVAYNFIYKGFGIGAIPFAFICFIYGFKLISGISLLNLKKIIKHLCFIILWVSVFSSLIFYQDRLLVIGGNFGYQLKLWMNSLFGLFGTILILFFSLLAYSVISFNNQFSWLQRFFKEKDTTANVLNTATAENTITEERQDEEDNIILTDEEASGITCSIVDKNTDSDNIDLIPTPIAVTPTTNAHIPELNTNLDEQDIIEETIIQNNDADQFFSIEKPQTNSDKILNDEEIDELAKQKVIEFGEYDPRLDLANFVFPGIDLLEQHHVGNVNVPQEELEANKNRIVETLGNYGINIAKIKATIGPTVTLYEIIPEAGVRISKIKNLEDDIALSLSALGIRIIAPIPGKGTIGIEVPNQTPEIVSMRSVIGSDKFQNSKMELPIVIGKTITNETFVFDLAKMPHLLMAGATGQGKSVGLNAMLASLLYKKHPAELKLVLVDPKKVELTLFNKIERHYLAKLPNTDEAIITDNKTVVNTLNSLCIEMDHRYSLLKDAMVRNIKEYNAKFISRRLNPENGHRFLPYIVVIIDEFADLIQTAGRDVEGPIARIAQLARAVGIHLIIATQRPSVNVITGLIKANFPARIAFKVTSKIDSRTILDTGGADQLIGRGDLLFSSGSDLTRIQCAFVDTPEVEKIAEFIGSQKGYPDAFLLPEVEEEQSEGNASLSNDDRDSLFAEAARLIVQHQQGSTSLIQRKLKLGYNRAGRIIDQLEAAGIVGSFEGSKAREVKIKDIMTLEQLLSDIEN